MLIRRDRVAAPTPKRIVGTARWGAIIVCMAVTALLPLSFSPRGGPDAADQAIGGWVHSSCNRVPGIYRILVTPSDSAVVIGALAIGVIALAWRRRWCAAGFLALGPELAVEVNEALLKPLWHRHLHDYLAYPSGHTFQFAAVATGFVLVAGTKRIRLIELALIALLLPAVAIGMVGLGYHYPTDVFGGVCAAVASVLLLHRGAWWARQRWDGRRSVTLIAPRWRA